MKLKDFLQQFEGLDPDTELYYESDDPKFVFKSFDDQVFCKVGYIPNSEHTHTGYTNQKSEDFNTKVIILK